MYGLLKGLRRKMHGISSVRTSGHRQRTVDLAPRAGTRENFQDIEVVDIDPNKLMTTLKGRFGSEFKVHVRLSHSTEQAEIR